MARTFGGVSTDRIAFPNYGAVNNLVLQTWSIWVYRTGAGGGTVGRILDKRNASAAGAAGILIYDNAGAEWAFEAHLWNGTPGVWSIIPPSDNAYHHFCVTYDAGSTLNNPLIYVDGVSQTVTVDAVPTGSLGTETETLNVGNRTAGDRNWAGALAEGSAHNVILTPTEVANLAAGRLATSQQPGALVWYAPIIGAASPEPNVASPGSPGVVTGTVQSSHPPVDAQPTGSLIYVCSQQEFL